MVLIRESTSGRPHGSSLEAVTAFDMNATHKNATMPLKYESKLKVQYCGIDSMTVAEKQIGYQKYMRTISPRWDDNLKWAARLLKEASMQKYITSFQNARNEYEMYDPIHDMVNSALVAASGSEEVAGPGLLQVLNAHNCNLMECVVARR